MVHVIWQEKTKNKRALHPLSWLHGKTYYSCSSRVPQLSVSLPPAHPQLQGADQTTPTHSPKKDEVGVVEILLWRARQPVFQRAWMNLKTLLSASKYLHWSTCSNTCLWSNTTSLTKQQTEVVHLAMLLYVWLERLLWSHSNWNAVF